jgi:(1->4)-alpha-D-glucan 1-alpha-D-glucosylmutase
VPDPSPTSTYRLQLHAGFGFAEAADIVDYLARLGISHLYLSPILQAAPGSMHGYDVVDHTRVSDDLGGRAGLEALAERARAHGLNLVVDVVPNHMSIPTPAYLNPVWWELLRDGKSAEHAHWFDVDWDLCGGRVGLPILGDQLSVVLEQKQLVIDEHNGEAVLCYFDQVLPLAPGTAVGPIEEVLAGQHYLLASWREKERVLGYRRFFDVDTLVAVRVELRDVFDATHELLLDLYDDGVIRGFRIDHPDGLADPQEYLERLRDATGGAWVVVEKILVPGEQLPDSWPAAGTTGYDAIRALDAAMSPPTGGQLDELWRDGLGVDLAQVELRAKREVLHDLFTPETGRLARRAEVALARKDFLIEADLVRLAIVELLVHIDRYRAYIRLGVRPDDHSLRLLDTWIELAARDRPQLGEALFALRALLEDSAARDDDARDLVIRFQQVCGPVMAKGIEDTTFYRFNRFIALNEVGGDPDTLLHPSVDALHDWARSQIEDHPGGMTTLSTHDTKRDEDVRARLLAAAADIETWTATWALVRAEAERIGVDTPTAYLVFQTVLGAWPIDRQRINGYLQKAVREAKQRSTWTEPNEAYEDKVRQLAGTCGDSGPIADALRDWVQLLAPAARSVNLSAKLLQLTLPGVPDVYQGAEQTSYSLVDPDNRRPVDFELRARRLAELDAGATRDGLDDDKLWVTSRALRLRRSLADAFGPTSTYRRLELSTPYAIGFERSGQAITLASRWPVEQALRGWDADRVALPAGQWVDVLCDARYEGEVALSDVFSELPVALLRKESR